MDLAAWWQARRWRALLELIDQLPGHSLLNEAAQNDPEEAARIALAREYADDDAPSWSPRVSEYDLHALLLREIAHNVAAVAQARNPTYIPSPRTEVDRMVEQMARTVAIDIGSRYGFSPDDF